MQNFINAYISLFKNYVNFNGRWRRRDFWGATLINMLIALALGFVARMVNLPILTNIYSLVIMIPFIAAGVRRLHDIGKKGICYLFVLIPLIGGILLLVWFCQPGMVGDNEFGPDPKAEEVIF